VEEAQLFKNLNINYYSCAPGFTQLGAVAAIESPESPREIARMVAAFEHRRDVSVRALNEIDGITCGTPKGAFYLFPNIAGVVRSIGALDAHASLPPATLFQLFLLFRYGVATLDRKSFGVIGSEGKHYLRMSIATSLEQLEEAVVRIAAAAGDREGFRRFVAGGEHLT
jgi:aspartate/methionine/tyrosine aminotransferase